MEQSPKTLKTVTFTPLIHIGFWSTLGKKKVEDWKLDDSVQDITTKYKNSGFKDKKSQLTFDAYSFDPTNKPGEVGPVEIFSQSKIINFNTIEDFNQVDMEKENQKLLEQVYENCKNYQNGKVNNLDTFTQTILFTFADLKKYIYTFKLINSTLIVENYNILNQNYLQKSDNFQLEKFDTELSKFVDNQELFKPYFAFNQETGQIISLQSALKQLDNKNIFIVIFDPFNQPDSANSQFNNLLALLLTQQESQTTKITNAQIILLKDPILHKFQKIRDYKYTQLLSLDLSQAKISKFTNKNGEELLDFTSRTTPSAVRQINLKDQMDELSLAKDAIDLNVKLMKWRMLPDLNFEKLKSAKCLLVGAGTLGCQLSRNLIGWGIQNITFIDNGKVSYSNPVRQSLYDYEDSINGGQPKALTAAKKLKKIFPEINSEGIELQIPMPGHFLVNEEQQKAALEQVDKLEALVDSHDVIFLMTDNRESRWLPTLLANKYNKMCITVGLGFDSYVIVRHGMNSEKYLKQPEETRGERLACYFCNDIAVPGNSMKDRTLDQQCTVTRPGLSFISAAYASELFVSMLSHPLQVECPASDDKSKLEETDLGIIPQHIRGSMSDYDSQIYFGKAFPNCVACSNLILQEYLNNRDEFLIKVINDNSFLHQVAEIESVEFKEGDIIEIDDEDDF